MTNGEKSAVSTGKITLQRRGVEIANEISAR